MAHPKWKLLNPMMTYDQLGFLPSFLDDQNALSARAQIDLNYQHGGGWFNFEGFIMKKDRSLHYKGDPPMMPLACLKFRDEDLYFYDSAWVCVVQPDGSYEVARVD